MWPQVAPLLAKALVRERGRFSLRDIRNWVLSGDQELWVITRQGRAVAAGLVRIHHYPSGKRSAVLHFLGGGRVREWALDAWKAWLEACHLAGITEMRIVGRRGWIRIVERFGFKPEAVILTREEA